MTVACFLTAPGRHSENLPPWTLDSRVGSLCRCRRLSTLGDVMCRHIRELLLLTSADPFPRYAAAYAMPSNLDMDTIGEAARLGRSGQNCNALYQCNLI